MVEWLKIKRHSPYVHGVLGMDITMTFADKIKLLFCKGIQIYVGDVFSK